MTSWHDIMSFTVLGAQCNIADLWLTKTTTSCLLYIWFQGLHRSKNSKLHPQRPRDVLPRPDPFCISKLWPVHNHKMPSQTRRGPTYYFTSQTWTRPINTAPVPMSQLTGNTDPVNTSVTANCFINKLTLICNLILPVLVMAWLIHLGSPFCHSGGWQM